MTAAAVACATLRDLWCVELSGDLRVRILLRIFAPFIVPRRTFCAVPCGLVYARVCEGGKSADAVKGAIVTAS